MITIQNIPNKKRIANKSESICMRMVSVSFFSLIIISLLVSIVILLDTNIPANYSLLFLLPISYSLILLINVNNLKSILLNYGTIIILALEFIRLVVSPLLLTLSDYVEIITLNSVQNTPKAILLLCYEAVAIAIVFAFFGRRKKVSSISGKGYKIGINRLHTIMAIYSVMLAVMCIIAPDVLLSHRTFFGVFTDKNFTAMTLDSVIDKFTGTEFQRYVLMLSRFFLLPYRLLLPTYLIICFKYYKLRHGKLWSVLVSFSPFLVVSDVIAQSVYFTMFLLLLTIFIYRLSNKVTVLVFFAAILAVVIYFIGRIIVGASSSGAHFTEDMSKKLIAYFSGLNIVSGTFNQPIDLANKFQYFAHDFLTAIPFNKTLLGLDQSISSAALFNSVNNVYGQIPTTIGLSYYYFGPFLSPLYSIVLAYAAKRFGDKLRYETIPLFYVVYLYMLFILSLGICMYNIEIAVNTIVQVILPLYIIAKVCFKRVRIK